MSYSSLLSFTSGGSALLIGVQEIGALETIHERCSHENRQRHSPGRCGCWFCALVDGLILVLSSGVGLFYYLRIVVAMYRDAREGQVGVRSLSLTGSVALAALTLLLVWEFTRPR